MDIRDKMKNGKVYFCNDDSLMQEQLAQLDLLYEYNMLRPSQQDEKKAILNKLFAKIGDNCYIETPMHCNWGKNTHFKSNIYANFNLTLVDDADIYVGDNVMFGPNVVIATAGHPILPSLRLKVAQFNIPVTIGDNVWIGANTVVLPGVTIGDNSVIGAGSVVTKDVPPNCVAVGNPCKVLRAINERDKQYYYKDMPIEPNDLD